MFSNRKSCCEAYQPTAWLRRALGGWASDPGTPLAHSKQSDGQILGISVLGEPRISEVVSSDEHISVGIGDLWLLGHL